MRHSDTMTKIAPAMVKAQAALKPAHKNSSNPGFKGARYADLTELHETARPVLVEHGLAVVQTFDESPDGLVKMDTTLIHESGEWIGGTLTMPVDRKGPQAVGSAITYARRYALAAILGMVSDEDDDANAASGGRQSQPQQRPATNGAAEKAATAHQIDAIEALCEETGTEEDVILGYLKVSALRELTEKQAAGVIKRLNAKVEAATPATSSPKTGESF